MATKAVLVWVLCLIVGSGVAFAAGSVAGKSDFEPSFFGIVPHVAYAPRLLDDPSTSFWETIVTVADVDDSPSHYLMKAFDATGSLIYEVPFDMSGHKVRDLNINRWFPDLSADQYAAVASITVESDGDFVLAERFKAPGVAGGLELRTVKADDWAEARKMLLSDKEYIPHIAETWDWWTGVADYTDNPGSSFTFDMVNHDGSVDNLVGDFIVDGVDVNKVAYVVEDFSGTQDGSWAIFSNGSSLSYELFGVHEGDNSLGVLSALNATSTYKLDNEFFVPVNDVDWSGIAVLNPNDYAVSGVIMQYFVNDSSPVGSFIDSREVSFNLAPHEKKTGIVGVSEGYDIDLGTFSRDDGVIRIVLDNDYNQWTGEGGLAVELVQGDNSWSHNEGITGLGRLDASKRLVAPYVSNTTVRHDAVYDNNGAVVGGSITPHETYLSLTNVDSFDENPSIQLYTNGQPNGQAATVHLKPHQTWRGTLTDLFGPGKEGMLVINSGKMIGSYTLMGSDVNAPLAQDKHLQSSMFKMTPVNRGDMILSNFSHTGLYVPPGVEEEYSFAYARTDGPDYCREMVVDWGDGSDLETMVVGGTAGARQLNHTYADMGSYDVIIKGFLDDGNMIPDFVEHRVVDVVPEANMATFTYKDKDGNPTDTLHANEPFYVHYKLENFDGHEIDGLIVTFAPNSTGPTTVIYDDIGTGQVIEGDAYVDSGVDGDASDVVDKLYTPAVGFNYVGSDDWHNNVYEDGEYTLAAEPIYSTSNGDFYTNDGKQLIEDNFDYLVDFLQRDEVLVSGTSDPTEQQATDYLNWHLYTASPITSISIDDVANELHIYHEDSSQNGLVTLGGQTYLGEQDLDELVNQFSNPPQ